LPRGLTLVELLVSLGLIAFIAMAFGTILGQARQLVSTSQSVIRANSAASAIAQVIREDLAGLSKEGFLAIGNDPNCLVFTATGAFTSQDAANPDHANAAVIDYGLDISKNTLWRRARVMIPRSINPDGEPSKTAAKEPFEVDGYLGLYRNGGITVDPTFLTNYTGIPAIPSYPYGPDSPDNLWPVLATECMGFKVERLEAGGWKIPGSGANPDLDAWSFVDTSWPAAVKVTFGLRMGDKTSDAMEYEVICPIRD
jgi:prepilin-type N-terminal cleavage/methylation domain-containing protein